MEIFKWCRIAFNPDALFVFFKFQVHVIHDMSVKFGICVSNALLYYGLFWYFAVIFFYVLYFCICCE